MKSSPKAIQGWSLQSLNHYVNREGTLQVENTSISWIELTRGGFMRNELVSRDGCGVVYINKASDEEVHDDQNGETLSW